MSKRGTVKQSPMYGCINCYELQSHPAGDLAVYEGECWCHDCWYDYKGIETGIEYDSLPEYEPAHSWPAQEVPYWANKSTNFVASNSEYRNPFYRGTFDDETDEQMRYRLHWATAAIEAERVVQGGKAAQLVEALEMAREFIVNGIALGYIQMPEDDVDDPAHGTAPAIEAVLAAYRKGSET